MQHFSWTDDEYLLAIQAGGKRRELALYTIYSDTELKRKVIDHVCKHQGNAADGQDMFHEGLIVLDRNVRAGKFRGESPLKGYLYSICRFLWKNQLRKNAHTTPVAEMPVTREPDPYTPETTLISEERKQWLDMLLEQLGERCKQILELWKLSYSMEEIADKVGFSSPEMARKAKYRCHLNLMELVQRHPQTKEL